MKDTILLLWDINSKLEEKKSKLGGAKWQLSDKEIALITRYKTAITRNSYYNYKKKSLWDTTLLFWDTNSQLWGEKSELGVIK